MLPQEGDLHGWCFIEALKSPRTWKINCHRSPCKGFKGHCSVVVPGTLRNKCGTLWFMPPLMLGTKSPFPRSTSGISIPRLQTQFWYLFEGSQMKSSSSQGLKMKHACNHQLAISSDIWDCPCLLSVRRQTKVAVTPWSSSCFENESIKWSSPPRIPDLMVFQFCLSQMKPIITNYTTFHDIRKCLNGLLMIWNSGCQQTFFSLQW